MVFSRHNKYYFMVKLSEKITAHMIIAFIFLFLAILMMFFGHYNPSKRVRSQLEDRGFDTMGIEFTSTKEVKGKSIFRSSQPLPLDNGEYCDQWEMTTVGVTGIWMYVTPYPDGEWPQEVNVNITFTSQEYEALSAQLDGQTVEEYVKNLCFSNVQ